MLCLYVKFIVTMTTAVKQRQCQDGKGGRKCRESRESRESRERMQILGQGIKT
jgi:hypothetical protein